MDLRDMFEEMDFEAPYFGGDKPPEGMDTMGQMHKRMEEFAIRHEQEKEKLKAEHKANNFHWPEDSDPRPKTWKEGELVFTLCFIDRSDMYESLPPELQNSDAIQRTHYNGYVRFPSNPFKKHEGYNGILKYVPVHGGLTFAEEDWDGSMVYGFDCAHADDGARAEFYDEVWLKEHCEMMGKAITICAWYESKYLNTKTDETRAQVIEEMTTEIEKKVGLEFNVQDNFGAMITVLCGGPKACDDQDAETKKERAKLRQKLEKEL